MTNLTDTVALAKLLMVEESVTPNAAGCFDLLEGWLSELGFSVWREVFHEDGYAPTENLYARLGDLTPNMCFAGHVDVVPVGNANDWQYPPFSATIADGYLCGRGAEDMKAAIAAMVSACDEFISSVSGDFQGSISFLLTADEEGIAINGTPKMLKWLEDKGEKLDYCLVGEPTNPTYLGEMCKIGRRGSLLAKLTVNGTQGHVAYPHLADNPITKLLNILHELKSHKLDDGNEFFQPSNLEVTTIDVANEAHNMIPATAFAEFNIRFNNENSGESLSELIKYICDKFSGSHDLEIRISGESFLTEEGLLSEALVRAVKQTTGHDLELSTTGGTSDARFIKNYCPVIEFGTTGFTPHKVDERVEIAVLEGLHKVYARFLKEIFVKS